MRDVALPTRVPAFEKDFAEASRPLELSLSLPLAPAPEPLAEIQPVPHYTAPDHRFRYRALMSRSFNQEFRSRLRKLAPWLISGGILGLDLILHAPMFVLGAAIATLTVRIVKAIIKSNPLCRRVWQWLLTKAGLKEKQIPWLSIGFGGGAWISAAAPSSAFFFQAAEQYVTQLFNGAAGGVGGGTAVTTMIPLLFGTLRVIFVIYIGIALVRVMSAFRNDEDWSTAARIPLVTVLCIVIGDALSSLIVQGAGGGG
jgi:hypothetical protein